MLGELPEAAATEAHRAPASLRPTESFHSILEPAIMKFEDKSYSLEPDMANGWRPRRKIFRQVPIRTSYPAADLLASEYTKFNGVSDYRVIYMGPRPSSNLQLAKAYSWRQYDCNSKEAVLYGVPKLRRYQFSYNRQKERPVGAPAETRLFVGMNPTVDSDQLTFDSEFQCGNLDLVMKVAPDEYDLFMRVDTNTRGHNSWFLFKCRNTRAGLRVKFNICNFHRPSSLFSQGMRPSVFSRLASREWEHTGTNITYTRCQLRYPVCEEINSLWCLSFEYTFAKDFDEVYFAYSPPYSYSYLMHFLEQLSQPAESKRYLRISYLLESPSGLPMPLLTISNPSEDQRKKKIVLVTGRLHPGETQGSWTLQGFLKYLCSESGKNLRSQVIFKVIPMVNVDGVVAGNFRTGLLGMDLNRLFRCESEQYYEIDHIRELAAAYKDQTLLYLDFHGHSTRKNVFIYGPDYKMADGYYMVSRIFPKFISKMTDTFRYYSCIFKISKSKQSTGRAVMLREFGIPFCYTVQSSAYSYVNSQGENPFTPSLYERTGATIAEGLGRYLQILTRLQVRKEEIKTERRRVKEMKIKMYKEVQVIRVQKKKQGSKKKVGNAHSKNKLFDIGQPDGLDDDITELLQELRQDEHKMDAHNSEEEESDCEKEEDDYRPQELTDFLSKSLSNAAQAKDVLGGSSALKRSNIYMSLQKVKEQNSEIGKSASPKNRVIIRDFVQEYKNFNRKLISNRSINYEKSTEELLPEIKSSRPHPKRIAESVGNQRLNSRPRASRWASSYAMREPVPSHIAQLKMATLQPKKDPSMEDFEHKILVRQGCIVNLRIDSESEHSSDSNEPRSVLGRFPEVMRREAARRKRRLQIVDTRHQRQEVPDIISDLLRRHAPHERSQNIQKSIQILRM